MDLTLQWEGLLSSAVNAGNGNSNSNNNNNRGGSKGKSLIPHNVVLNSPFLLQAVDLISRLVAYERIMDSLHDEYISYHRFYQSNHHGNHSSSSTGTKEMLTQEQCETLYQDITLFITTFGNEIHDLKRMVMTSFTATNTTTASREHYQAIIQNLADRLGKFTQITQSMHKKRLKESLDPILLFSKSNSSSSSFPSSRATTSETANKQPTTTTTSKQPSTTTTTTSTSTTMSKDFATRYEDEIASTSKLREYKSLGESHRSQLMKEAKDLRSAFAQEMEQAHNIESNVHRVASLLSEFTFLLKEQSSLVEGIHVNATQATDFVKQTDKELQVTIQRSKNNSRNIVMLAVGLGFLLLLLDFVTP